MSSSTQSTNGENQGNELKAIESELLAVNPEFQKVLSGLKKEKKEVILRTTSLYVKQHSGPLPDPETLSEYNELIKDGAERIMVMAEKQQNHVIQTNKMILKRFSFQHLLGQIFAFTLCIGCLFFGYKLTIGGHPKLAGTLFGTTIIAILIAFLRSGRSPKE